MKKGNRKHVRLLAMAMSLAVVGMLAAFIALAAQPAPASAQDLCDGPLAPLLPQCLDGSTPPPPPRAQARRRRRRPMAPTCLLARCSNPAATPAALASSSP